MITYRSHVIQFVFEERLANCGEEICFYVVWMRKKRIRV